jgi:hypothetical protein
MASARFASILSGVLQAVVVDCNFSSINPSPKARTNALI